MLSIGDALALVSLCTVIVVAVFRFSSGNNVREKECLLRSKNICNKLKALEENTNELFKQFNDLNLYLRKIDK